MKVKVCLQAEVGTARGTIDRSFACDQNFFGFADDKLIYDERKKRFVHTTDMPGHLSR